MYLERHDIARELAAVLLPDGGEEPVWGIFASADVGTYRTHGRQK